MSNLQWAFRIAFVLAVGGLLGLVMFAAGRRGAGDAGWRWEPAPPRRPASGPPWLPPAAVAAAVAALAVLIGSVTIVALNSGGGDNDRAGEPPATAAPQAVAERSPTPLSAFSRPAATTAAATPTPTAAPRVVVRGVGSSGLSEGAPFAGSATLPGGSGPSVPAPGPPATFPGTPPPTGQSGKKPRGTPVPTPTPVVTPPRPATPLPVTPSAAPVPVGNGPGPRPAAGGAPAPTPTPTAATPHSGEGDPDDDGDSDDCEDFTDGWQAGDHEEDHSGSGSGDCND